MSYRYNSTHTKTIMVRRWQLDTLHEHAGIANGICKLSVDEMNVVIVIHLFFIVIVIMFLFCTRYLRLVVTRIDQDPGVRTAKETTLQTAYRNKRTKTSLRRLNP